MARMLSLLRAGSLLLAPLVLAVPAAAHAADAGCAHADVQRVRAAAGKAMERRDYEGAAKLLSGLLDRCSFHLEQADPPAQETLDFFWLKSDLSLALYRAGKPVECLKTLATLTTPKPPESLSLFGLDEHRVGKAIEYNERLCQAAHDRRFAGFTAAPCPRKAAGKPIAVPAGALPAGARAACLAIEEAEESPRSAVERGGDADPSSVCPRVRLWTQGGKGWRRSWLQSDGGPLDVPGDCCNLSEISVGMMDGKRMVRLKGGGRNCLGGTESGWQDALYEWRGDTLTLVEDNAVSDH